MKKVLEYSQAEVGRFSPAQARELVLSIFPAAVVKYIENAFTGRKGYTVNGTNSRMWTGYQKNEDNAWKSAANMLWQLFKFYPKEVSRS
jgi:hypothetical protein